MSTASISPGVVLAPASGLSEGDREFVAYLAQEIQVVAEVLDDIQYSQLFDGITEGRKRDAVSKALVKFICETSTRLVKELAKAKAPKRKAVA